MLFKAHLVTNQRDSSFNFKQLSSTKNEYLPFQVENVTILAQHQQFDYTTEIISYSSSSTTLSSTDHIIVWAVIGSFIV